MSSITGGDITEVTFNHPTLGTGVIYPKSGEDSNYDTGGFRGNDDSNMVDGAGNTIRQLNRVRWFFEIAVAWDISSETLETLSNLAGDPVEADWTFTNVNGAVYGGKGAPVGDIQGNGNTSVITLKVAGGGKMKKIV